MDASILLGDRSEITIDAESLGANNMRLCHGHDRYELYYLKSGNRILFADGCFHLVRAGDLFLIPPGMRHRTIDVDGGYEKLVIMLPCSVVPMDIGAPLRIVRPTEADAKELLKAAEELVRLIYTPDLKNTARCMVLVMQILSYALSLPQCKETPIASPALGRVADILNYIEEKFNEKLSLSLIAEHFFISEYYLCRIFKEYTGRTVNEYVTSLRLETAERLLTHGESVRSVIKACGFGSEATFARLFREKNGCCAKEFQKKKRSFAK